MVHHLKLVVVKAGELGTFRSSLLFLVVGMSVRYIYSECVLVESALSGDASSNTVKGC